MPKKLRAIHLDDEIYEKVSAIYKIKNFSTISEFVDNAIREWFERDASQDGSVYMSKQLVSLVESTIRQSEQRKERYGEETAETVFNSCHDTIAGAFGPLSQDAEFLSKQLGSRTARTGSVTTDGKTGEQSSTQQMMEVPLMAPNELREMPKGDFVLLKTFCRSVRTHRLLLRT